jgi:hypothetical protein
MQGIVIQGPTTYCKQIVEHYKHIKHIVWSTWNDEPVENLEYIKQHIPLIVNEKPSFSGYLNVNLQVLSTFKGIEYLKNKEVTEIFKIRGDVIITEIDKMLDLLKGKQLSFLQMCKPETRKDIYYELVYSHFSHDYPADVVIYGSTDILYNGFNFYIDQMYAIPPESLVAYSLLDYMGVEFLLEYNHLINNGVTFFMEDCLANNIDILWLKRNTSIVNDTKDKNIYEY